MEMVLNVLINRLEYELNKLKNENNMLKDRMASLERRIEKSEEGNKDDMLYDFADFILNYFDDINLYNNPNYLLEMYNEYRSKNNKENENKGD